MESYTEIKPKVYSIGFAASCFDAAKDRPRSVALIFPPLKLRSPRCLAGAADNVNSICKPGAFAHSLIKTQGAGIVRGTPISGVEGEGVGEWKAPRTLRRGSRATCRDDCDASATHAGAKANEKQKKKVKKTEATRENAPHIVFEGGIKFKYVSPTDTVGTRSIIAVKKVSFKQ